MSVVLKTPNHESSFIELTLFGYVFDNEFDDVYFKPSFIFAHDQKVAGKKQNHEFGIRMLHNVS